MTADSPHVLVAYDGSDFALRAARRGLRLLEPTSPPTILFVVRPTVVALAGVEAPVAVLPTEDLTADEITEADHELAAAIQSLGVDAIPRVECGDPGPTICRVAAADGFDVIVVGSHGAGWMKRLLVGSVSNHVLHHARCPVLVVREERAEREA